MSPTTYYIIGGVAVFFIIYMIILSKNVNRGKAAAMNKFKNEEKLSHAEEQLLAFGAILFVARDEPVFSFVPNRKLTDYEYGLKNQWDIYDSDSAKEALDDLLNLYRTRDFDIHLENPSPEIERIQKRVSKDLDIPLADVQAIDSTYAWDIGRAIPLARGCYWIDYISKEECLDYMRKAAQIAVSKGKNWREYSASFLLGRTIQGFDPDEISNEINWLIGKKAATWKKRDLTAFVTFPFLVA
ncbi:DUF1266 domain-containing protein [Sphingobacterium kyonggiense]